MLLRKTGLTLLLLACPALALDQATTQPATRRARHEMVVPPGFKVYEVAGRRVLAEPADEAWVRKAMTELAPATRPTTAPADMVEKLRGVRPELAKRMVGDLALADDKKVEAFLDTLMARTETYRDLKPPIYYLATSRSKAISLVKGGWKDPRYYYNRAADDVMVDTGIQLSVEGNSDDMVLPALYRDDAAPDARAAILMRTVQGTERLVADEVSRQAQVDLQVKILRFIADEVFRPMNLKEGQQWFAVGVSGVLSARYASMVTGTNEEWMLTQMTAEFPRLPIKAATVDLLHPTDLNVLTDRAVPFYLDAVRRKSVAAVRELTAKGGADAITKVVVALRQTVPADGEGLVALIKRETGVDLTVWVRVAK